jgi:hypothetical protein
MTAGSGFVPVVDDHGFEAGARHARGDAPGGEQSVPGAVDRNSHGEGLQFHGRPSIGGGVPANGDGAVGGDGQFKTGEPFRLAGVVAEVRQRARRAARASA